MKKLFLPLVSILLTFTFSSAFSLSEVELQKQRAEVVKQYVKLLGRGDYQALPKLFTDHAVAVAPSGEADNINRFYESLFKKTFSSPESRLINVFDGRMKNNMMTAYYNLTWVNAEGEPESAKFVDLFIFQMGSTKIKTIYVFSNSFKEDVFNDKPDIKPA